MLLDYYMGYGNAMYRAEKYQEAIPLLEKAVSLSKARGDMETENHNNRLLLDSPPYRQDESCKRTAPPL